MLELKNISKFFTSKGTLFKKGVSFAAVDNISLSINHSESIGIAGESGSGKSTLAKIIADVYKADQGEVLYHGTNLSKLDKPTHKTYRKNVQMIFQNPMNSLNPKLSIRTTMLDALNANFDYNKNDSIDKIRSTFDLVGLPYDFLDRYPHQFSGGQRQRISIARSLILEPDILIADEPLSMLDVSVQAQILNLLIDLKEKKKLTIILISHSIAHISILAEKMLVMKKGKMVEYGNSIEIINKPDSEYTKDLIKYNDGY